MRQKNMTVDVVFVGISGLQFYIKIVIAQFLSIVPNYAQTIINRQSNEWKNTYNKNKLIY